MIEQEMQVSFETALRELYNSRLFQDLADEPTKIWHFSDYLLLDLFKQEKLTGKIDYPNVF
ncbi:MAG TPA: hypothetical protein PLY93_01560 [Turneriella sp.]|nr:hypothetical protein [Turneriella sp.]